MAELRQNTWSLDEWYDQSVAGTTGGYTGLQQLWVWGYNEYGGLGLNQGPGNNRSSPTQIPGSNWSTQFYSYAFGNNHGSISVKTDGTLWTWGINEFGELGLNQGSSNVRKSSPTQIPGTTWSFANRGNRVNSAIKTDGTLWMWGRNEYGVLGLNQHDAHKSSPTQVGTDTTWSKAYMTVNGCWARKTDGTVWVWGYNQSGTLGLNQQSNTGSRSSPTQLPGDWVTVKASNGRASGVKTDGTLWTWGANSAGELGLNNRGPSYYYSSPTQVGSGTDWSNIFLGSEKMGAVKTNGTLYTWGNNYAGTLGLNDQGGPTSRSSPTQVPGTTWSSDSRSMSMSYGNTTLLKTDGTLWIWGSNSVGQLGQGDRTFRSSPVQVPGNYEMSQLIAQGSGVQSIRVI